MSITLDVEKVVTVVKKDAAAVKTELETLFGKDKVDLFLSAAEAAGKTALGAIAKGVVTLVEANMPGASGAAKQAAAASSIAAIAKGAGVAAGEAIINQAIETFVPTLAL
jgi:hypothetical protein